MLTRLVTCAAMAAARLLELSWSRRNIRATAAAREGEWSRRTYPAMVALHASVLVLTLLRGGRPRSFPLAVLIAMQPLRAWVLLTLGARWNTRGAVSPAITVATDGPYRWVRHPNYAIVAVELAALPLAFGAWRLALLASAANAALLTVRIREEEALLSELPAYRAHFATRARFIPRLF